MNEIFFTTTILTFIAIILILILHNQADRKNLYKMLADTQTRLLSRTVSEYSEAVKTINAAPVSEKERMASYKALKDQIDEELDTYPVGQ